MELNESFESQINRSDYKILIVDDVMSNVLLLKILLTNEKFQVCTANNGNMCIEQAKKEKPAWFPSGSQRLPDQAFQQRRIDYACDAPNSVGRSQAYHC